MPQDYFEDTVEAEFAGLRLDVYLAERLEDASRSYVKKLIKDGRVRVKGDAVTKPGRTMTVGERVEVDLPPPPSSDLEAENIPIEILYQDRAIVVVNKPSGMVVHPGAGNYSGTLVNALLYHCPDFHPPGSDPIRPGIVHRLDRYTSGVLVVAKTEPAFLHLSEQVREHSFNRRYLALVRGEMTEDTGRIDAAVGRSLADPTRMSVTGFRGREAVTHFRVLERLGVASLLAVKLETGRTHQIRVHLRFTGHPVIGDPVYGDTDFSRWAVTDEIRAVLGRLEGQALHAELLGLEHPRTGEYVEFTVPPPADFQAALDALRNRA